MASWQYMILGGSPGNEDTEGGEAVAEYAMEDSLGGHRRLGEAHLGEDDCCCAFFEQAYFWDDQFMTTLRQI